MSNVNYPWVQYSPRVAMMKFRFFSGVLHTTAGINASSKLARLAALCRLYVTC
jgi:hypothetical protein